MFHLFLWSGVSPCSESITNQLFLGPTTPSRNSNNSNDSVGNDGCVESEHHSNDMVTSQVSAMTNFRWRYIFWYDTLIICVIDHMAIPRSISYWCIINTQQTKISISESPGIGNKALVTNGRKVIDVDWDSKNNCSNCHNPY